MLIDTTSKAKQSFLYALVIAAVLFLPFVVMDGGYFIYYGDFNVQQIPFYKLAHEAVRGGDLYWSWYTDLGANFIGSYGFYLLFSPFFWLTLPFPTEWVPFLMAPLLVLKTACASLTAYLYLERFVRDRFYALAGGLLYAFSGWMLFNIFFNHFHDVAVFFPLLLLSVEKLVTENKRGFFAVMVAVCAMVNYWFFIGEAVFVVLYVFIRMGDPAWRMRFSRFLVIVFESVLGVALAALVLAPSVLALSGNPRTGLDSLSTGWDFWLYWHEQRQPAILQSLFFPPELPARPNFFPDHGAKWASLSAWLPMLSMAGVFAYFFGRRWDWLKRILAASLVMALVPGLNNLFILLNNSYYARWFFMPVLLMCLATARALEDVRLSTEPFRRGIFWTIVPVMVFTVMSGLTPRMKDGELVFGMAEYPEMLWAYAGFALIGLLMTAILVVHFGRSGLFKRLLCGGAALMAAAFGIFYLACGRTNSDRISFVINTALGGREELVLPDEPFSRADVYDGMDNLAMFWHLPNIQAFHSIVPVSIMEFYPEVGVKRDVGSRPEADFYALRPLLSVRWLFIGSGKKEQEPMPGYTLYSTQIGHNIYENENYLPMGFGYDHFLSREQLGEVAERHRGNIMLRALVLEDEGIMRNMDILEPYYVDEALDFSYEALTQDVGERRGQVAHSFSRDRLGFTAEADLSRETLLFFSVPYEKGWSATVNGAPAVIEKANVGFMAVRVPAGESVIRFDYRTPGLYEGLLVSGGAALALIAYLLIRRRIGRRERQAVSRLGARYGSDSGAQTMSWEEYLSRYRDRQERRAKLQRALNEAARVHIDETLDESQRTLHFTPPGEQPAHKDGQNGNTTGDNGGSPGEGPDKD